MWKIFLIGAMLVATIKAAQIARVVKRGKEERERAPGQISAARDIDELMGLIEYYGVFTERAGDVLLLKALQFEETLDKRDWAEMYYAAPDGSELERVAEAKAGNILDLT